MYGNVKELRKIFFKKEIEEIVNKFHVQASNQLVLLLWVLTTHGVPLFIAGQEFHPAGTM